MKKFVLSAVAISVLLSSNVFASSDTYLTDSSESITVESSVSGSNEFVLNGLVAEDFERGTSKPTTVSPNGGGSSWSFSGTASNQDLYTEHYVTGKTSYDIQISNYRTADLKAYVYINNNLLSTKTFTVPANGSLNGSVTGLSATDKVYIKFAAPCDFNGSIVGK